MKCENCKAWERKKDEPNFGICHRHAPGPLIMDLVTGMKYQLVWPASGKDDYCLDYVDNEPKQ